ncbi:MAG: trypsin-like peptidase domain-containing protein [Kiritimatiellae bacterium]|nr:trypsin-like peptidase domain-containing protein [Kiritimatiellia bacterium]MDD5519638.1 trypsin-like peptidase domain-containing protein [Kiritimatiellia bacterium]
MIAIDFFRIIVDFPTMVKKAARIIFLINVLLLFNGCISLNDSHRRDLYRHIKAASVEVLVDGHLEGSGWFADPAGYVITAAHAVSRSNISIEIVFGNKGRLPAEIIASDRGHDIALLKIKEGTGPYQSLKIADSIPDPEAPVYLYGSPMFHHGIMLGGIVARDSTTFTYYTDRRMLVRCYHVTAPSPPGTSGGPWVDRRGQVVGNQSGFITHQGTGAGIALVAPPDAIHRLVATKKSVPTPTLGCGLEELWTQSPGFIKRFPKGTEGVVTIPIDKGGSVEAAGLNKESLIISIEGQAIRYKDDLYRVIHARKPGDIINIKVLDPDKTTPRDVQIKLGKLD